MKFYSLFFCLICLAFSVHAQQIKVNNSTCVSPAVCLSSNQAQLSIDRSSLTFDPNDNAPKRRFQAFWITGDGNYLQFPPEADAASLDISYNFAAAGNYSTTAYLTGKYTNRKPPARAVMTVPVSLVPGTPEISGFNSRLGKLGTGTTPMLDVFSNHAIRRNNLTAFVVSWPADVQATGLYFFFNGYEDHTTGQQRRLADPIIRYSNVEVPRYFDGKMNAAAIQSTAVVNLRSGAIPGMSFNSDFVNSFYEKFSEVLYFPAETAGSEDMPRGFTENRYFPVMWTDSILVPRDTLLNFYVLITGSTAINDSSPLYGPLDSLVRRINPDLNPNTPFAFSGGTFGQGQPQYIQAVAQYQLPYLATFDPNQLTVENVVKLGNDEYEVTFRLEMCNKGRGDVFHETVDIVFSNDFQGFQPLGFVPDAPVLTANKWSFGVNQTIPGVEILPNGQHEESSCTSVQFKAKTNCNGLRSLWKGSPASGVSSCVVFDGAISPVPECHGVTRIDSTQYQADGACYCCRGNLSRPNPFVILDCNGQLLCLILIAVILLIGIWWLLKRND